MSDIFVMWCSNILMGISVLTASYAYAMVFRSKMKSRLLAMLLFFAAELTVEMLIRSTLSTYAIWFTFLCDFLFFVGLRVFYRGKWWHHAIAVVIMDLTSLITESASILLLMRIMSIDYFGESLQNSPKLMIGSVIANITLALALVIEIAIFKLITEKTSLKYLLLYIIVPVYQLILVAIYYRSVPDFSQDVAIMGVLFVFFSIFIDMFMVHTVDNLIGKRNVEKELSRLYEQRQMELAYYESAQAYVEHMSVIRHEFNNRLQTAYSLLKQKGENKDIKELLDGTNTEILETKWDYYCDNAIVNSVLLVKKGLAEQKQIQMDISATLRETIGIEKIDLCSVFCNLLDNAIEACEKLENTAEKKISIKVCEKSGYLVIKSVNPLTGERKNSKGRHKKGNLPETTKPNKQEHGYGTKLIQQIVKKYEGDFRIEEEDGLFTVIIMMRIS